MAICRHRREQRVGGLLHYARMPSFAVSPLAAANSAEYVGGFPLRDLAAIYRESAGSVHSTARDR